MGALPFLFAMNFPGPSLPNIDLLSTVLPEDVWLAAMKQAQRSPMIRFKVGCVIWDPSGGEIIAKGCSHPDVKLSKVLASVHAERHAVHNAHGGSLAGTWAVVYTASSRGGCAYTSRPCYSCARALYNADVARVVFAERTISGGWTVTTERPGDLLKRATRTVGLYARQQRIPAMAGTLSG